MYSILPGFQLLAQQLTNETEAFAKSKELNRPVLLVFSGSDWCVPCIRFQKEILSDSSFMSFADANLVILKAEFPQKKKLAPELVSQNEKLAAKYNTGGAFPKIVLLGHSGDVIDDLNYNHHTPSEFIGQLKKVMPVTADFKEFKTSTHLMGCGFEFTIIDSANSDRGWQLIQESVNEVKRIEHLISEWIDTSQVSRLNANAGIMPVKVSPELYDLISRSIKISEITQGAFDITFGGVGKSWDFDRENPVVPDSSTVNLALSTVGYKNIILLDSSKVFLSKPGIQIGFGAIGKGYAAKQVKKILMETGIGNGVINASGDLTAWGSRPDGSPWKVGISDPYAPDKILLWLPAVNNSIATSGDYENYFEIDGVRYAHIIDPRTGYPTRGIQSVTLISPDPELSDALATAVFVMGVETGIDFIEQLPDTYCIIVDDKNKIHYSEGVDIIVNSE